MFFPPIKLPCAFVSDTACTCPKTRISEHHRHTRLSLSTAIITHLSPCKRARKLVPPLGTFNELDVWSEGLSSTTASVQRLNVQCHFCIRHTISYASHRHPFPAPPRLGTHGQNSFLCIHRHGRQLLVLTRCPTRRTKSLTTIEPRLNSVRC